MGFRINGEEEIFKSFLQKTYENLYIISKKQNFVKIIKHQGKLKEKCKITSLDQIDSVLFLIE